MSAVQQMITIVLCSAATILSRFLPFAVFRSDRPVPKMVLYLGKALPGAVFGMLVVYCLKNVSLTAFPFGIPEAFGILATVLVHLWKRNTLFSMFAGTAVYMVILHMIP